jgi:broad specificity phosphatase PhoE
MNLIYLVRHGENVANLTKEFSCRKIDYSLTPRGVLQARQTAAFFKTQAIHAVYCSPLKRAIETAEYIAVASGLPWTVLEELRELDVGELEGAEDLQAAWEHHNRVLQTWFEGCPDIRFPQGENQYDLIRRMQLALSKALEGRQDQHIVMVGHGGIFRATIEALCPAADMNMVRGVHSQNCSYARLAATTQNAKQEVQLLSWGEHDHLSGEAAAFTPGVPSHEELRTLRNRHAPGTA